MQGLWSAGQCRKWRKLQFVHQMLFFCFLYEGRERNACRDRSDIRAYLYMDLHKHTGKSMTWKASAHGLKSSQSCTSNSLKCWFCKVFQANGWSWVFHPNHLIMVCSTLKARPLQQSDSWDSFWVYEREGDILALEGMQEKSMNVVLKKKERETNAGARTHCFWKSASLCVCCLILDPDLPVQSSITKL